LDNVIDLQIEGEADSIGVTDNHPFSSKSRQAFVAAADFGLGPCVSWDRAHRRAFLDVPTDDLKLPV